MALFVVCCLYCLCLYFYIFLYSIPDALGTGTGCRVPRVPAFFIARCAPWSRVIGVLFYSFFVCRMPYACISAVHIGCSCSFNSHIATSAIVPLEPENSQCLAHEAPCPMHGIAHGTSRASESRDTAAAVSKKRFPLCEMRCTPHQKSLICPLPTSSAYTLATGVGLWCG